MDLIQHLQISTPMIWVTSQDVHEVESICLNHSDRQLFLADPLNGVQVYDRKLAEWRLLLAEVDPDEYNILEDTIQAIVHLIREEAAEEDSLVLVYVPDGIADKLQGVLLHVFRDYLDAVRSNDASKLPVQIVFISAASNVPAEIASIVATTGFGPPNPEEIVEMVNDFAAPEKDLVAKVDDAKKQKRIVRSVAGLSRVKLLEALSLSVLHNNPLDPVYLEEYRKTLIKQETFLELIRPTTGFDHIGGLDNLKKMIKAAAHAFENPEEAEQYGIEPVRRILLVGVPGTGKSAICKATAFSLGLDLVKFGVSQMMNKYIGQSEANMRAAFSQINAMAPIVAWIDELGRDLSGSHSSNDSGTTDRVHGEFLTGVQELGQEVFLIGAANYVDGLPPEMLRAGRFDHIVFVGFPAVNERLQIWNIHLGKDAENHDLVTLAKKSLLWTGAEIESIIKKTRFMIRSGEGRDFTTDDLLEAMKTEKNRLWLKRRGDMISMYQKAVDEFEWASSAQREDADKILAKVGASKQVQQVAQGW